MLLLQAEPLTLSEIYYWILLIVSQVLTIIFICFSEDIKSNIIFKNYLMISSFALLIGIIMELTNWEYLPCKLLSLLIMSIPIISLLSIKFLQVVLFYFYKKTPFHINNKQLRDGIWVKNKGDIKEIKYYAYYTSSLVTIPAIITLLIFILIEGNFC